MFCLFSKKFAKVSKLHPACPGEDFEENYILFWKTRTFFNFFWFLFVNVSENLLKQHSKCPEDLLEGKKVCLENHTVVYHFCDLERIFFGPPANLLR